VSKTMQEVSVQTIINKQVANWAVLYIKLHNFHWFVKGSQFLSLHIKFEELYTEAGLHLDELAERLLALGGNPIATMKESLTAASIKEAVGGEIESQMVAQTIKDFETIIKEVSEGTETATKHRDEATADMFIAIRTSLEKHVWMLNACLGK
jgi:starvation-inducible DNA-binding protein